MRITRLGHSMFLVCTPQGHTILIDPWLHHNPTCPPETLEKLHKIHAVLLTHEHPRHEEAIRLLRQHHPFIHVYESSLHTGKAGMLGTMTIECLSSGPSCSYVLTAEDGFTLYVSGPSGLSADFSTLSSRYRPDVAIVSIEDSRHVELEEEWDALGILLDGLHIIPCGDYPEPPFAPQPEEMEALLQTYPSVRNLFNLSQHFERMIRKKNPGVSVTVLGFGETFHVHSQERSYL
jgi:L-ascorbate metabolism protein UlaG (beta-lactamase superfamily)